MNYKIVEQVSRKKKSMSGVLRVVMIVFAVLFVVMGITISQAFMLPGFLLAGLYFVFDIFSQKDYEYTMENGQFEIDVIYGKNYRYNSVDALMNRPKGKSLEVVARFNHTDLNDIMAGHMFYGGKFYSSTLHQSFGVADQSVIGGKADTFTLGVNYYVTDNIVARLNYSYQKLNQEYTKEFMLDKNLHSIQARVAFEF